MILTLPDPGTTNNLEEKIRIFYPGGITNSRKIRIGYSAREKSSLKFERSIEVDLKNNKIVPYPNMIIAQTFKTSNMLHFEEDEILEELDDLTYVQKWEGLIGYRSNSGVELRETTFVSNFFKCKRSDPESKYMRRVIDRNEYGLIEYGNTKDMSFIQSTLERLSEELKNKEIKTVQQSGTGLIDKEKTREANEGTITYLEEKLKYAILKQKEKGENDPLFGYEFSGMGALSAAYSHPWYNNIEMNYSLVLNLKKDGDTKKVVIMKPNQNQIL